jgi:TonB family protein
MQTMITMRAKFTAACAAIAIGMSAAPPAAAGIREYNAAVTAGDYDTAATEAEAIWTTYDKTQANTAVIAREFAWTSMLADEPEKARVYASFLVQDGARLSTPDDDPLMSKVLLEWTYLGDALSGEQRQKVSAALSAWANNNPGASRIGPFVAGRLYGGAWAVGNWRDVIRDAALAETLSARLGAEGLALQYQAIVDGAAADFMQSQNEDGWIKLADAWDFLFARIEPPRPGQGIDLGALEDIYWRSQAWMHAMEAFFERGRDSMNTAMAHKRAATRIENRQETLKGRCGEQPCPPQSLAGGQVQCPASWNQTPELRYPQSAMFRGMMGATILQLTTNKGGQVTDAKVLAAVPAEVFPDAATKTISQWTLKSQAPAGTDCTLSGTRELRVIFQLQ